MPAPKTAGAKRKAAGCTGNAAKSSSSSSPKAVFMVQCTRSSFAEHIPVERDESDDERCSRGYYDDEEPYSDDAFGEHDAVGAQLAAAKYDGTWVYGTAPPGSSIDEDAVYSKDDGVVVFRTLKDANAYAAEVWDELQENPPFYAEAEVSDSPVRKTKRAEGGVKYQRIQTFHHDACCSESTVVRSTLTVQVVAAQLR